MRRVVVTGVGVISAIGNNRTQFKQSLRDGRGTQPKPSIHPTLEAVRRIIPALLERGYHLETVSTLCQKTT